MVTGVSINSAIFSPISMEVAMLMGGSGDKSFSKNLGGVKCSL